MRRGESNLVRVFADPSGSQAGGAAYSFEEDIHWVPAVTPTQFAVAEADSLNPGIIVTVDGVKPHITHLWRTWRLRLHAPFSLPLHCVPPSPNFLDSLCSPLVIIAVL